jgi:hypothetical protein
MSMVMPHRAWFLILCLLASSLMATATVHAQENSAVAAISCSGPVHADGDGDQVPASADRGMPHHHGTCHGHAFAVDNVAATLAAPALSSLRPVAQPIDYSALRATGPALRPPRG